MEDRGNKTIMCSVFFLDIVEYSKKSVAGQISLKERFNSYLSEAIRDVPIADRIILDTGDGAAINFLGDVEDALKAALSLRESLLKEDPKSENPLLVRMGINLGPVRLVRDINGQPNIVGDGINVAQRVMGFADSGQVLVSRSYYDAVSRLSPQYAEMFHYQGSRTDKHVREHEVYAIGYPGELAPTTVPTVDGDGKIAASLKALSVRATQVWDDVASRLEDIVAALLARLGKLEPKQRMIYAGIGATLLLAVVAAAMMMGGGDAGNEGDVAPSAIQPVSAVVAAVSPEKTSADKVEPQPVKSSQTKSKDVTQATGDKKPREDKKASSQPKAPPQPKTATQPKTAPQPRTGEPATHGGLFDAVDKGPVGFVAVSCKEGAQVFVDGTQKGKIEASGVVTVSAPPGRHAIIVSHSGGGIANQSVEIQSGKTVRIRPGFCAQ